MSEAKIHRGSCHCGAVRYEVELDTSQPALTCNCSMCGRSGAMLAFTTPDKFRLLSGEESLTDYQFAKHVVHHLFCKTCGIKPFGRGQGPKGPMVAVNLRCVEGVDVFTQPVTQFDGKSR